MNGKITYTLKILPSYEAFQLLLWNLGSLEKRNFSRQKAKIARRQDITGTKQAI